MCAVMGPSRIENGLLIRRQISRYNNLPIGRIGDVRFEITTEGCEEKCMSVNGCCERFNVERFAEISSNALNSIEIKSQIR